MGKAAIAMPEAKAVVPTTDCKMNTRRVVIDEFPSWLKKFAENRQT
jgi:hypothetical protein